MNWKTLGKAALVTCGLFGIIALILVLGHFFPWICGVLAFVSLLAIVYSAMDKGDRDSDSDRMQWFSSRDDEEEEEEDD